MKIEAAALSEIQFEACPYTEALKDSLKRIGLNFPIHVRKLKNGYQCVDGAKRLSAIQQILQEGYRIAKETAGDRVKVFADIGPIMEQKNVSLAQQYQRIADVFLAEGADCFLFETLLNTVPLRVLLYPLQ